MSLSLLDEKVRSRLRSGVAISTMAQCVEELVENSLDAGAKCIAVRVDTSRYKVQVCFSVSESVCNQSVCITYEMFCRLLIMARELPGVTWT